MTAVNFERSLGWLLLSEGGNTDDASDHGGRTSRGVTQREYDAYRTRENLPLGDVFRAVDSEIKQIYYFFYWQPWCDRLPGGYDYVFFDMSVLQGAHTATQVFQRALGITDDGVIGIITWTAIEFSDRVNTIKLITQKRMRIFYSLRQPKYTSGWINRAMRVEAQALSLFTGT